MNRKSMEDRLAQLGASAIKKSVAAMLLARNCLNDTAFYCNALHGGSDYNICINSDLTVSCNCSDKRVEGIIGDISRQSLREIFAGEKAGQFRRALAAGKFPIRHCPACSDLRVVPAKEAPAYIDGYSLPIRAIMLENITACNLDCIGCRGEWVAKRSKKSMSLDDMRIASKAISECGIEGVQFFNLGEPFLSPDFGKQIKILLDDNPELRINTSTNGILLDTDEKREAALLMNHLSFSIHGASQESLCRYQRGGDFAKAYDAMKLMAEYRNSRNRLYPKITWNYVLFRWNDSEALILRALNMARKAKIDNLVFVRAVTPFYAISWRSFFCKPFNEIPSHSASRWYKRFVIDL